MNKPQISERPLAALFGSESAYRVLMYLENYDKGYASEIAKTFGISLNQAQNQLNITDKTNMQRQKQANNHYSDYDRGKNKHLRQTIFR